MNLRYANPAARVELPELASDTFEAACSLAASNDKGDAQEEVLEVTVTPTVIALVDSTGTPEWLDLITDALSAALEALPPSTRFGLVLFGSQVNANLEESESVL